MYIYDFESYRPPVRLAPGHTGLVPPASHLSSTRVITASHLSSTLVTPASQASKALKWSYFQDLVRIFLSSCAFIGVLTFRIYGVDYYIQLTECSKKEHVVFVNSLHCGMVLLSYLFCYNRLLLNDIICHTEGLINFSINIEMDKMSIKFSTLPSPSNCDIWGS